ncbi:noroxomaritidine synthase-like [Magnolia sinica]|uniref:noroxomaritidine synthase-like n=1 Tax=Magnolia sinica TaxID=86752 RepID=UPI002659546C|nr:noroxomaritidine synthase-like [Magnolia sinica]
MGAWLMNLWCILRSYPEILLLAFACFFFIYSKNSVIPVNWPLVGMLPSIILNSHRLHEWVTQGLRECGSTFIFHGPWLARRKFLMTCDPANVKHIMVTRYPEILLVAFACFFFIYSKNSVIPVNWPLVGMLPSFIFNAHRLHEWVTQGLRECGSTFLFHGPWFAHMEILMTCDPANVKHIMVTRSSNFPRGDDFLKIFDVFGDGIINSELDVWRFQRKMHHTLFSSVEFRRFVAKMSREKVENGLMPVLEHKAQQGKAVDLQDVLQRFMLDSTCILVFGADPGSLSLSYPIVPFSNAKDDLMEVLLFRHAVPVSWWMLLRRLMIGEEKKLAEALKTIDCFINEHISKRMEEVRESKMQTKEKDMHESCDLLAFYINYRFEDEIGISKSFKFLRDNALNLLVAGKETMTPCLT